MRAAGKIILIVVLVPITALGTTIKITSKYPEEAIEQCIEGWAVIEFSVLPGGETTGHKVIDSQPEGVFEESALEAARKLDYSGLSEPVEERVDGVTFKFAYNLDEASSAYSHCR